MISSTDLGFIGLCINARISSRDWPKFAFNSIRPLLLNSEKDEKYFSHIIVTFKLHTFVFNTTITNVN